jgi:outer membrane immunogenic protein
MKKLLLATAAAAPLLAMANLASAADLGVRAALAPAPVVPVYTWTGLYVGGGWGYGMYNLDTQASSVLAPFSVTQTLGGRGWLGTVTAGGDYQLNNWLVIGAFGDYDWANIKQNGSGQNPVLGAIKETSAWAVGARAGYAVTPAFMTYFNGGFTQARFSGSAGIVPTHTYSGWFIGSGVETRLNGLLSGMLGLGPGWFWRTEYRFSEFQSASFATAAPLLSASVRPFTQTVRTEITYKFNWGY